VSHNRYELPPPPSTKQSEVNAWQEALDNSAAQLEHQSCRILNLEIMSEHGSQMWREYIKTLTHCVEDAQKQLGSLKHKVQEINLQRKSEQTLAGERLSDLERTWVHLVSKNYEIECACVELEKQLIEMRRHKHVETIANNGHQNGVTSNDNE
jgi:pre-mRNA-splicing factor SPF27